NIGRGFANDFKIADPSVSGSHCKIIVENGNFILKDLGSTNGTFINRSPVTEASLEGGQTIHLGGVEMVFQTDPAPRSEVCRTEFIPRPVGRPRSATAAPPAIPAAPPPVAAAPPPVAAAPPSVAAIPSPVIASQPCKFHQKTPGRYYCNK